MVHDTFDVLILIGRPASGKSEILDFLKHTAPDIRRSRFHIAELDILDDFPMLWIWFEEDRILNQQLGQPRLYTDEGGYFKHPAYWHLLIERLSLDYQKRQRDDPAYHDHTTALVEFSRGSEHGGYGEAFPHLADDLLQKAAIVYVNVSFVESLRKNRRRFNPQRPDSILEHGLSDEKMERLYQDDDWGSMAQGEAGFVTVRAEHVPYAVFENEDDVTTGKPELLAERLEEVLNGLWVMYSR
ncbi:hypothetical protein GW866_05390 [bacterium]|nr:hypothetical protein [bacterium]OIO88569.1 MAG: hypothetical protein AUK02_03525 [Anaerolineae bacterium CG2_30_58_95]PIU91826.1 MAG: hypothetical protein COS63_00380 [Anaerolineae bacterium CG06_land_8_20_14_3_00_57_67]PIW20306.1 MAG: hypothetical protein COW33_02700 [Anaerolineae bacterium CG17_big_fil_post_rev_8_21_14_2_50_57_27]PJH75126.1 MAG: hypothetical protein CO064_08295 [Anaerolineae bacterium CG_4_9_14_0_8_um_filter_58_9]